MCMLWIVVNAGSCIFFHWRWSCLSLFFFSCAQFSVLCFSRFLSGRVCGVLRINSLDLTVSFSKSGFLPNSQVAFSNLQWTNPERLEMMQEIHISLLCSSQHLQHHESGVEGESCYYHCVLCNYSTKAKLNLIQHVRSMKHQRSESLRKLQRLQKGLPEEEEDLGQIFTIRKCPAADAGECCFSCTNSIGLPARVCQYLASSIRLSAEFLGELGDFLVSPPCFGVDASLIVCYGTCPEAWQDPHCTYSVRDCSASLGLRLVALKHCLVIHMLHFILADNFLSSSRVECKFDTQRSVYVQVIVLNCGILCV